MSKRYPVVAVTGSSGAGTSTVKRAFEHIFARENIIPAVVEGDSYHRFERGPMKQAMADALSKGENFSHFGPEANLFDKLEELFSNYSKSGTGQKRYYLHSTEEAEEREKHKLNMSGSSKAIQEFQSQRRMARLSDVVAEVDSLNIEKK